MCSVYHVGFPILNRAAFGVFGAWWPTFNRAVMAIVWNGVNVSLKNSQHTVRTNGN